MKDVIKDLFTKMVIKTSLLVVLLRRPHLTPSIQPLDSSQQRFSETFVSRRKVRIFQIRDSLEKLQISCNT